MPKIVDALLASLADLADLMGCGPSAPREPIRPEEVRARLQALEAGGLEHQLVLDLFLSMLLYLWVQIDFLWF